MPKRAILYARVSGDDRHNEGRNLQSQLKMCHDWAIEQGLEIVAELAEDDRGAPGAAFELPQLNRVRELGQAKAFDVLVVREIDRLSRSLVKQLFVEEELHRDAITIEYVLGDYPDTPEGRLNKHIRATLSEFEREKIRERMVRGRYLKVQHGSVEVHGRPPFGYRLVKRPDQHENFEINEDEAAVVRQIFTWYTVGDEDHSPYTLRGIRRKLNELKIASPGDRGKPGRKKLPWGYWSSSSVSYIISSEVYAGVWRYGKARNFRWSADLPPKSATTVAVPAIVSRETWDAAHARTHTNREEAAYNVQQDYLMRRRIRCGHCHAVIGCRYSSDKRHGQDLTRAYYQCLAAAGKSAYEHACDANSIRVESVDEAVWAWVVSLLTDEQLLLSGLRKIQAEKQQAQRPLREHLAEVERRLAEVQAQLGRLVDLYIMGDLPKTLLDERKVGLQTQRQTLTTEQTRLLAQLDDQPLTDAQITGAQDFAAQIAAKLTEVDSFAGRRFIIEALDVRAILSTEDDHRIVDVYCEVGQSKLVLPSRYTKIFSGARRLAA